MKLKWKVQPEPTGRYRSFEHRGWPQAELSNGDTVAIITCDDSYVPALAKAGHHKPLKVRVADYSRTPGQWYVLKERFETLDKAKKGVVAFLNEVFTPPPNN